MNSTSSLLHQRGKGLPCATVKVLNAHTDEVWNVTWSHDGVRLASASKDKTAIIWRIGDYNYVAEFTLREHPFPVSVLAWSLDDMVLATSADQLIVLWDTKTGKSIRMLDSHSETVSALVWLPDGSGFMSAGLDGKIFSWDLRGGLQDSWNGVPIRVTDMAITPDMTRLVTVGMDYAVVPPKTTDAIQSTSKESTPRAGRRPIPLPASEGNSTTINASRISENRMIVYLLGSRTIELSLPMGGDLTSVKISEDSRFALINQATDEVHLWDLNEGRFVRKFTGQRQSHHVIRSCFGSIHNIVISGSEDCYVYLWHRDTGALLGTLPGHGMGSVNSVAWNPRNDCMFASCSDDRTIRIWEPLVLPVM